MLTLCSVDVYATTLVGMGDGTVGDSHGAQISQFEFFELILLLKLDKQLPVEQIEATVSQSTVPSPLLLNVTKYGRMPQDVAIYCNMWLHVRLSSY